MGKTRRTAYLKALARTPGDWQRIGVTDEMRAQHKHLAHCAYIYSNNRVECQVFPIKTAIGGVNQLTCIRHGNIAELSWEELQRIVHELFGPEVTAVEVYPPLEHEWQTNLGLRVLWVLPSTWPLPFGLHLPGAWGQTVE